MSDQYFVFTGGPGSGKSSVLEELARRGWTTMPEAGRAIIRDQIKIGGTALPWSDRALFAELMLAADMRNHGVADSFDGPVLFDRGVPDILGYLRLCGLPIPHHIEAASAHFRYNKTVIAFPHWPEIYANDAERKQSEAEAKATYDAVTGAYSEIGYEIFPMPLASVAERADVVEALARGCAGA